MNAPLQKSRLGRGLASLIGDAPITQPRETAAMLLALAAEPMGVGIRGDG